MQLLWILLFLLLLTYHAISAPTPFHPQQEGRSFKVDRVRRAGYIAHGPTALRKVYRKYGIVPTTFGLDLDDLEPINVKHAHAHSAGNKSISEPDRTGTVSATSVQNDAEFVSPVIIGGQKIIMTFDTGSSDLPIVG